VLEFDARIALPVGPAGILPAAFTARERNRFGLLSATDKHAWTRIVLDQESRRTGKKEGYEIESQLPAFLRSCVPAFLIHLPHPLPVASAVLSGLVSPENCAEGSARYSWPLMDTDCFESEKKGRGNNEWSAHSCFRNSIFPTRFRLAF
jgi:hypothetical protein